MTKNDTALMRPIDVVTALVLMTRLPLPHLGDAAFARQARACWAFPLVGVAVGGLAGAMALAALWLGLPVAVAAGLGPGLQVCVTGAMHEDGLTDTADGFWGGFDRDRRLEIMADSRIGAYGVIALILSLGLRWSALTVILALAVWPVVLVAVLSRGVLPAVMAGMPRARPGGLSDRVGAPPVPTAAVALGLAGLGAVALGGWSAVVVIPVAIAGCVAMAALAQRKIAGQTGDVLGATQQVVETLCLIALATLL